MESLLRSTVVLLLAVCCVALPQYYAGRPRRGAMTFGYFPQGYYYHVPRSYEPQGAMTYASGRRVAAGSYYRPAASDLVPQAAPCSHCHEPEAPPPQLPESEPQGPPIIDAPIPTEYPMAELPASDPVPAPVDPPAQAPTTATPAPKSPKKPKVPVEEDEDEEEYDEAPAPGKGKGRGNNYFPMYFGFPGMSGRGSGESGGHPGVATAVANSYSTGRGAIATSHATAYGGPNLGSGGYKKSGSRSRPHN